MKQKKYCQVCFEEEATVGDICQTCYEASIPVEITDYITEEEENKILNKLTEVENMFTINECIHETIERDIPSEDEEDNDLVQAQCISIESEIEEVLKDTNHSIVSTKGYRSCGYDEFSIVAIWIGKGNKIQTYEFQIEYC